ncbi:AAA family ATPase [Thiocystis violascens]|nr:bifunctional aminoglycoside phosphotransferase/ATP-binding protein [Thiocystis violascens]
MEANDFSRLIQAMMRPEAYPHPADPVRHIETHISHVMLAGDFAYKLKKPLDLGFLDFSTLERRRHFCEEELRLNWRLAEDLYLEVVAVTGTPTAPRIGGAGPVLEYAVKMRRFPQAALLDRQPLTDELMIRLAEEIADFHARIPVADHRLDFGSPAAILAPMLENLAQVRARDVTPENLTRLARLETWIRARFQELAPTLEQRRRRGHVRECHGDMHRGNIALVEGRIRIFDAIEFNPNLRWIDTASEVAFLIMDLEQAGEAGLARLFLNRYLERSGDYGTLDVLDFYKVYRAMVRAKVAAIRLGQGDLDATDESAERHLGARYLALAESYTQPRAPHLLIVCGVSGSGKSCLAMRLREALPLIHLRSDVERKRLFGLSETARTQSGVDSGIYFPSATNWTYERLHRLADAILANGYDVLVDATFIARERRERFMYLARKHRAAFAILALDAPIEVLRQRLMRRLELGNDASEADLAVLERQLALRQCLSEAEKPYAVMIDSTDTPPISEILASIEAILGQMPDAISSTSRSSETLV